jgi:rhodanese-related sulfurtransferase
MTWLLGLTVNQRLALVAFLLGTGAVFARPTVGATVSINPQELAVIVQRGADRVEPIDLANWIIEGRSDYRLIDLRDQAQYSRYHIPTAENVPMASLPSVEIEPTEKVLVYSDDGARSAQGWFLLRARGLKGAYLLNGGLEGWKQTVLFPILADGSTQSSDAKLLAISRHFGGAPRAAGSGAAGAAPVPDPAMSNAATLPPPPPPVSGGSRPKAKKKEGC